MRGDVCLQTSGTSGEEWEMVCRAGRALLLSVRGCGRETSCAVKGLQQASVFGRESDFCYVDREA